MHENTQILPGAIPERKHTEISNVWGRALRLSAGLGRNLETTKVVSDAIERSILIPNVIY